MSPAFAASGTVDRPASRRAARTRWKPAFDAAVARVRAPVPRAVEQVAPGRAVRVERRRRSAPPRAPGAGSTSGSAPSAAAQQRRRAVRLQCRFGDSTRSRTGGGAKGRAEAMPAHALARHAAEHRTRAARAKAPAYGTDRVSGTRRSGTRLASRRLMTRLSSYFLPTLKEPPADAEAISHVLMVRAGPGPPAGRRAVDLPARRLARAPARRADPARGDGPRSARARCRCRSCSRGSCGTARAAAASRSCSSSRTATAARSCWR